MERRELGDVCLGEEKGREGREKEERGGRKEERGGRRKRGGKREMGGRKRRERKGEGKWERVKEAKYSWIYHSHCSISMDYP